MIGDESEIRQSAANLGLDYEPQVADPSAGDYEAYAERLHELRSRKELREAKPAN